MFCSVHKRDDYVSSSSNKRIDDYSSSSTKRIDYGGSGAGTKRSAIDDYTTVATKRSTDDYSKRSADYITSSSSKRSLDDYTSGGKITRDDYKREVDMRHMASVVSGVTGGSSYHSSSSLHKGSGGSGRYDDRNTSHNFRRMDDMRLVT